MIETISAKRSKSEPTLKIEISEKIMELPLEERKFKNGWSSKPFERNNTIKETSTSDAKIDQNGLTLRCALAHAIGLTCNITGFNNLPELYRKLVELFGRLEAGNFVGLTVADNGVDKVFVKRIKNPSISLNVRPQIKSNSHMVMLIAITDNTINKRIVYCSSTRITMLLVEPKRANDSADKPTLPNNQKLYLEATRIQKNEPDAIVVEHINMIFDSSMSFRDDQEFAQKTGQFGSKCANFTETKSHLHESNKGNSQFADELISNIWAVINDWRRNRLSNLSKTNQ
ncbi:unnamed protein product [Dracunculus medinensis]|uniref:MuF_C domain-containing protein n=1 Tax=Dracunculus medinensis TaxID=318479 RepID=A0A0N4UKJ8_DRAME|nr:unnamed protein product [Dracunculus medinensis]